MKATKNILIGVLIGLGIAGSVLIGFYLAFGLMNQEVIKLMEASYVGTLLAGAASILGVYLLYLTYQSQKKELQATQEALRLQKIDTAFFNMLSLLLEIINAMSDNAKDRQGSPTIVTGRAYLKFAINNLHSKYFKDYSKINRRPNLVTGKFNEYSLPLDYYEKLAAEEPIDDVINYKISESFELLLSEVSDCYEEFYKRHQQNLGHYFRYVYNIIKYVVDPANRLSESDQQKYLGILQAQLSNDEMGLIFYNVLSKHGKTTKGEYRFLKWLDKFKLLENMDVQSLKDEWHHWFFPNTNFKFLDQAELDRKIQYQRNLSKFNLPL